MESASSVIEPSSAAGARVGQACQACRRKKVCCIHTKRSEHSTELTRSHATNSSHIERVQALTGEIAIDQVRRQETVPQLQLSAAGMRVPWSQGPCLRQSTVRPLTDGEICVHENLELTVFSPFVATHRHWRLDFSMSIRYAIALSHWLASWPTQIAPGLQMGRRHL
jgi:hypothetical protein